MTQRPSRTSSAAADGIPARSAELPPTATRLAALLVAAATILTFAGVAGHDWVWDDHQVLVLNDGYRGLGLGHLRWMFTTAHAGHYHPLTWLSFALDWQMWGGLSPAGFHLTNVALHGTAALGFFFVCRRLLAAAFPTAEGPESVVGAAFAALLFAVHPLRVESVAWITERRDVLSGALLTVTLLVYLRFVAAPPGRRGRWLALALAAYVLSLLSKAAGMTLPLVLLLLDAYPLRRFRAADSGLSLRRITPVLLEKVAFLVPAIIVAFLALNAQAASGALRTIEEHAPGLRIAQAFYGTMFYLIKTVWPVGLIPLYEQDPAATASSPASLAALGGFVMLSAAAWLARRRVPSLLVAWLAYVILLSPMLGLARAARRSSRIATATWRACPGRYWPAASWSGICGRRPARRRRPWRCPPPAS